jgi:hypothetical protein
MRTRFRKDARHAGTHGPDSEEQKLQKKTRSGSNVVKGAKTRETIDTRETSRVPLSL